MKNSFTILLAVLITASVYLPQQAGAQAPQKISYQAVIRNSSNDLIVSHAVGMKISILKGSATGTLVYTETQTPTTNANGLVSLEIGAGIGFDTIKWANDIYFIKTETDPTGYTTYTITGTSQLLSVPYALNAKTTDKTDGYDAGNSSGNIPVSNGTVNTNLNADMLDGYHAGSFEKNVTTGTVFAGNYTDITIPHYYPFILQLSTGWPGSLSSGVGGQALVQGFENDGRVGLLISYSNGADYSGAPGTGTVSSTYKSNSMSSSVNLFTFGGTGGNAYTVSTNGTNLNLRISTAPGSVEVYYKLIY